MTHYILTVGNTFAKPVTDITYAVVKFVYSLMTTTKQHSIYKQTVKELQMMTDRELCDIGITRGDIETVAREAAK